MTPDEFRTAIETLWPGHGSQARAAREFQINDRRIRAFLNGERTIPDWLATEINDLLAQYPNGVRDVDPSRSIAILRQQMEAAGWTAGEAAASILAVALANARATLGEETVADLLTSDEQ